MPFSYLRHANTVPWSKVFAQVEDAFGLRPRSPTITGVQAYYLYASSRFVSITRLRTTPG